MVVPTALFTTILESVSAAVLAGVVVFPILILGCPVLSTTLLYISQDIKKAKPKVE